MPIFPALAFEERRPKERPGSGTVRLSTSVGGHDSNFSIMRGPTPYAVGGFDLPSNAAHPWKAVAAGNLDGDAFDEIVAIRKVTAAGVPDLFVMKVNPSACDVATVAASATIGNV
jgi:hypothetical protein